MCFGSQIIRLEMLKKIEIDKFSYCRLVVMEFVVLELSSHCLSAHLFVINYKSMGIIQRNSH